ncbi:ATP-binding protein [Brevundimonas pondensis]|uniref:histidine kinase n=1 Tax=Brevundimonas pondensis TaxID=2774189 RepID=A0ABX7SIX9_9CAUL|nr:ATP-binding protein [Brevundimonas pondensis]QTC86403.1 response regulator [Brevundimonas pondensis]
MLIPDIPEDEDGRISVVRSLETDDDLGDVVLSHLLALARRQSGASIAYVSLLDAERQRFVARSGLDAVGTTRAESLCGHAILQPDRVLWVEDARADPRFEANPLVLGPPQIRFYASAPLLVDGRAVGGFCIAGSNPYPRDEAMVAHLQDLSLIAAERLAGRQKRMALQRALEAASDAFVVTDEHDRIIYWSGGAERLFGFSQAEASGGLETLLGLNFRTFRDNVERDGAGEPVSATAVRGEAVARRKDGSTLDIEIGLAPWFEDGARRTSTTIKDISRRKAQRAELERARAGADAANHAKSAFLANMSHELRTPLNGVIGLVELLARTPLSAHQQELAQVIQASAERLRGLIGDILDLARIESGELQITREAFDLCAEVERAFALCALKASEKGLDLQLHQEVGEHRVFGDPLRLKQVLINLLNNAIKFTDAGSVSLHVSGLEGGRRRFEVRDTGMGFSVEQRGMLFERFHQTDGAISRHAGGTGLGLAICRELVEAMGGVIDACAEPGAGATFWFELPLGPAGEAAEEKRGTGPDPERPAFTRVLAADDNETNRRVLELILGAAGVSVTTVNDGAMAIETWRQSTFDAVLMDMMMPGTDGLAATRAIRALESREGRLRTPIVMLTAHTLEEHVAAALAAGADLHLAKPITASALYEALSTLAQADEGRQETSAA